MSYHHITEAERYQIYAMIKAGQTNQQIAETLRRAPSSISREIRRNRGQKGYRPRQAHERAQVRQCTSAANARCISVSAWQRIEKHLREDWSPEQIAGRTGLASTESIYLHVYQDKAWNGRLWLHLRCRKQRRKRYGSGRSRRGQIIGRIPINQRPKEVEQRCRLGDWEGDTLVSRASKASLVTLAERRSQLVRIRKVQARQADQVRRAICKALRPLKAVNHTLTLDNGKEFAMHQKIRDDLGIDIYFADPYASWQRGLNEQINGLIRQYLPKGKSMKNLTDKDVSIIEKKLNSRPRKMLDYQTPIEVFNSLTKKKGVALRH